MSLSTDHLHTINRFTTESRTLQNINKTRNIEYYLNGNSKSSKTDINIVFQVHYGSNDYIDQTANPAKLGIAMQSDLFPVDFTENWYAELGSETNSGSIQDTRLHFIETGGRILIFGEIGDFDDIEETTYRSYSAIFDTLRNKGYSSLVRFWNFIPHINEEGSGSIENYRIFCVGRARAFNQKGIQEQRMPAATGIGSHSDAIVGYLVATKHNDHLHIENPVQSPAYTYPFRYSPKPPSFARGTALDETSLDSSGGTRFYLSGTASIRQAETIWKGDVEKQLHTTMENINFLINTENPQLHGRTSPMNLSDFGHFKVYFRRSEDYARIKELLVEDWQIDSEKLYFMNVDICRSDLLVELEGCINDLPSAQ